MKKEVVDTEELCKVGDTLYRISKSRIVEVVVSRIEHYPHCVYKLNDCYDSCFNHAFGKTIFKTRQDAELALNRQERIKDKRILLKAYEKELNERLNLQDHLIIK